MRKLKLIPLLTIPCLVSLLLFFVTQTASAAAGDQSSVRELTRALSEVKTEEYSKMELGGVGEDGEEDGLIHNADYRGVTTHPSPLPKHP